MNVYDVFYFHAHFGADIDGWQERDEYGFIIARDFTDAMYHIVNTYRDELMSVEIEYAGDTGIISVNDKEVAEDFKKAYIKTHYGEEETEYERD